MASSLLRSLVEKYLPNARWWPWKGVKRDVRVQRYEHVNSLLFLVLEVNGLVFQLPLLEVDRVPEYLLSRCFCLDSRCFIEAEYSEKYISDFLKLKCAKYWRVLRPVEEIKVYSARPLTLESTNAVTVYESNVGELVLKSYRLIPRVNIEAKMLECLARRNYKYIPRVQGLLHYAGHVSGVLMEYVKGRGDGGYPFYIELVESLKGAKKPENVGLSAKLGIIIGEMHIALNTNSSDEFFGVEPVLDGDISKWAERIERMYRLGLKRVDEVTGVLNGEKREELEHWRSVAESAVHVIGEVLSLLEKTARELFKARIHQDLHLAQMIYTGDGEVDFVITDFEGEPGRTSEERLAKEPILRDIASMIRSFHYLSHAALMGALNVSRHRASLVMGENDPTFNWRAKHVIAMTYSYLATVHNANLLGTRKDIIRNVWSYLYPWIVERAVYEFYYEALYRPTWISIPLVGILEARKYVTTKLMGLPTHNQAISTI